MPSPNTVAHSEFFRIPKSGEQDPFFPPVGALKLKDAARYLGGISVITVRRLIQRGLIKPNRATRHLLISVAELNRFIAGGGTEVPGRARK